MKKALCVLCALLIGLACCSVRSFSAAAAETGKCGTNVNWRLDEDGTLTVSGKGKMYDFDWGGSLFYGRRDIKRVVVEEGVISVGASMFHSCWELERVTLPAGIVEIGNAAFMQCEKLSDVVLPDSLLSIDAWAFDDCVSLTEIYLPKKLLTVGDTAFSGTSLERVVIPESVLSIEDSAFYGCRNLRQVVIAGEIDDLGLNSFAGCGALRSVSLPASLQKIDGHVFSGCNKLSDVYYAGTPTDWERIKIETDGYSTQILQAKAHCNAIVTDAVWEDAAFLRVGEAKTVNDVLSAVNGQGKVSKNGQVLSGDEPLCSGMQLRKADGSELMICIRGDVDGDGMVTSNDARCVLRYSVRLDQPAPWQEACAAVFGDEITSDDARLLLRASVALERPRQWY